jgi:hypothetical protein
MVDFVGKGQQLGGRWLKLSARVAFVSVTVLNATNLAFMAVQSYFSVQGLFLCFAGKRVDYSDFCRRIVYQSIDRQDAEPESSGNSR